MQVLNVVNWWLVLNEGVSGVWGEGENTPDNFFSRSCKFSFLMRVWPSHITIPHSPWWLGQSISEISSRSSVCAECGRTKSLLVHILKNIIRQNISQMQINIILIQFYQIEYESTNDMLKARHATQYIQQTK